MALAGAAYLGAVFFLVRALAGAWWALAAGAVGLALPLLTVLGLAACAGRVDRE